VPSNAGAAQDRQIRIAVPATRGAVRAAARPVLIVVSLVLAQDLPPMSLIPDGGCDPGARAVTGLILTAPPAGGRVRPGGYTAAEPPISYRFCRK
jgi:hypothetical protein